MKYLLVIISIVCLASCRPKPIDINVKQAETKTVVGSQLVTDEVIAVWLTRSFSALSNGTEGGLNGQDLSKYVVKGANVSISYNNLKIDLVEIKGGLYISNEINQLDGVTYTLNIEDTLKKTSLKASAEVLPKVKLKSAVATADEQQGEHGSLKLNYSYDDPAGKNYYMFNVYVNPKIGGNSSLNQEVQEGQSLATSDLSNLLCEFSQTWVIEDTDLGAKSVTAEHIAYFGDFKQSDTVFTSLSNISKEYYDFLFAQKRSEKSVPFVSEPLSYPSNIQNGLGFFAMHNPSVFRVNPK